MYSFNISCHCTQAVWKNDPDVMNLTIYQTQCDRKLNGILIQYFIKLKTVIRWSNHDKTLTFYNWTLNDLSYVCTFWSESLDLLTIYRRARAWAFSYKKEHTYVLRKVYPNIRLTCRQEIVLYVGNVDLKFSKWQDTIEYANDWPVICIDIM